MVRHAWGRGERLSWQRMCVRERERGRAGGGGGGVAWRRRVERGDVRAHLAHCRDCCGRGAPCTRRGPGPQRGRPACTAHRQRASGRPRAPAPVAARRGRERERERGAGACKQALTGATRLARRRRWSARGCGARRRGWHAGLRRWLRCFVASRERADRHTQTHAQPGERQRKAKTGRHAHAHTAHAQGEGGEPVGPTGPPRRAATTAAPADSHRKKNPAWGKKRGRAGRAAPPSPRRRRRRRSRASAAHQHRVSGPAA